MHTVLIAEDDAIISGSLEKVLSRKGLNVLTTDNGIEALKLIKEQKPEALLLDINLPGISGLQVLEEVRKLSQDLKVIVITGTFDSETEQRVKELGVYAFLKKPFMVEVLLKLLTELGLVA